MSRSLVIQSSEMSHTKHKKQHRQRSPSSSESDTADEDGYREKKLSSKGKTMEEIEEERQVIKAEKKFVKQNIDEFTQSPRSSFHFRQERDLRKVYETPHEKRQRRLAKKTEKERKRKAALGWDAEHMVSQSRFSLSLRTHSGCL